MNDDHPLENFKVVLEQRYFVPEYYEGDNGRYQLFEDVDGNELYYKDGALCLKSSKKGNVVVSGGQPYLVRNGRAYLYQDLVDSKKRELLASGVWVLNENFNGNGSKFNVVAVPNLDGMAEDEAVKALADAGLIANVVKGAAAPSADRAGTVYEQAPKSGGTLLVGSKVTITVYDAYVEPETPEVTEPTNPTDPGESNGGQGQTAGLLTAARFAAAAAPSSDATTGTGTAPTTVELKDYQLVTLTDENGDYLFRDLPAYVLVDADSDHAYTMEGDKAVAPTEMDEHGNKRIKVYQPQADFGSFDRYQKGAFGYRQVSGPTDTSMTVLAPDGKTKLYFEPVATDGYASSFTNALPYLAGYSVRVLNDGENSKYLASRYHVDAPGKRTSDLQTFNAEMTGDYNEDGFTEATYAVVAQAAKNVESGSFGASNYQITYRGVPYDLANRLYEKFAGDAGLVLRHPVLISGTVWEDANANGIQDNLNAEGEAGERGIEGAVVKLERYWYDASGLGSMELKPGEERPAVTPENTELTFDELVAIYALGGLAYDSELEPPEFDIDAFNESENREAMVQAMTKWLGERSSETGALVRTAKELDAFDGIFYDLIEGYYRLPDDADVPVWVDGDAALSKLFNEVCFEMAEDGSDEAGVWRRDWTFTQKDVVVMVEGDKIRFEADNDRDEAIRKVDINSLSGNLGYQGAVDLAGGTEETFPIEGIEGGGFNEEEGVVEYIPGGAFDKTVSTGDWAFLAPGIGEHKIKGSDPIKVLYGYRVEIVSYPNEDTYRPTLQHVGDDDTINSDFDLITDALRPNEADMKQDSGIESDEEVVGDLIVLSRAAADDEGDYASGPLVATGAVGADPGEETADEAAARLNLTVEWLEAATQEQMDAMDDQWRACIFGHPVDVDGDGVQDVDPDTNEPLFDDWGSETLYAAYQKRVAELAAADGDAATAMVASLASLAATAAEGDDAADNGSDDGLSEADRVAASLGLTVEWIMGASESQLKNMPKEWHDCIFGHAKGTDADGNPVYDAWGSSTLMAAYEARMAELNVAVMTNRWSGINWLNSMHHDYGVVPVATAKLSGVVWQDEEKPGNGIRSSAENSRGVEGMGVVLTRYWYDGASWQADDSFGAALPAEVTAQLTEAGAVASVAGRMTASRGGDGYWEFADLPVAGLKMVNGRKRTVLYGYEVHSLGVPNGYQLSAMNQGGNTEVDSDLAADSLLIEPDPSNRHDGMIVLAGKAEAAVAEGTVFLAGPAGVTWAVNEGVDSAFHDTGLWVDDGDEWITRVYEDGWLTKLIKSLLAQTGDNLLPWMVLLAALIGLALLLILAAKRRKDDDEEDEDDSEEPAPGQEA